MTNDRNRAQELFQRILNVAPTNRPAILDWECGGESQLRKDVEAMLSKQDQADFLLIDPEDKLAATLDSGPLQLDPETKTFSLPNPNSTLSDEATKNYPSELRSGTVIADRYHLQKKIGEGGMGEVWVAKQTAPIKRKVALKLIKKGMDSRAVLARFEQERQALALMDHPHIASVYDAGMTPTGQPFFVMELVNGKQLTQFCDDAKLTPNERLELFVPICQAVQHAHHKGIVHRDLKPGNIIVSLIDGKPVPKVIDFGVAKATGGKLTEQSLATDFGSVVGTLEYMSPEQASLTGVDIDTRADIYSLGVVLYELLTGLRPIGTRRLQQVGLTEMVRLIQEEEPAKPSTQLSTNESLPSLAAVRNIDPKKLSAMLRGELDWVVMKCLEKQRERRYETANALAGDIQRYLLDEPVEARPPSAGYRFHKFLKRNRGPAIAAGLVVLALIAGIAGTSYQLIQTERARADAVEAQQAEAERAEGERLAKLEAKKQTALAVELANKEKAANAQAQKRLVQIAKSNEILGSIFETLDPSEIAESDRPLQAILVDKLDHAAEELVGDSIGDPLMVAAMQDQLGMSLLALSAPEKAIVLLEKSRSTHESRLGPNDPSTIASMSHLGKGYLANRNVDQALALFKATMERQLETLGAEHPDVDASRNNLALAYKQAGEYDLAVSLLEESVDRQTKILGADHPDTLTSVGNLASAYHDAGTPELALPLFEATLKIRQTNLSPNHPDILLSMNNLAFGYESVGDLDQALPLYEQTLQRMESTLGPVHSSTLTSMANLAALYQDIGDFDSAIPMLKKVLKLTQAELGPNHPDTLLNMVSLASGYQAIGEMELALPMSQQAFELMKAKLGEEHPHTVKGMNNLALNYQAAGKFGEAQLLFENALALMKVKLGPDHPDTLTCMGNLATIYQDTGEIEKALPLFEEAIRRQTETLGSDHPDTVRTMNNLAVAYWSTQQLDKSIPLFEKLVEQTTAMFGRDHPNTLMTIVNLGVNLKDYGKLDKALPLLEEAYQEGQQYPWVKATAGPQLLDGYAQAGKTEQAVELANQLVVDMQDQLPEESPERAGLLAKYGLSLVQAKAFSEAEDLLRQCLKIREQAQPDSWLTSNTKSMLGDALLGKKEYKTAEPLLIAGYEGLKEVESTIPESAKFRLNEAIERLVKLYDEAGDEEQAAQWRAELEKRKNPTFSSKT